MKDYLVQIAVIRTIRQYRKGGKKISGESMRQLEGVLRDLKRTHSQPKRMSS